MLSRSAKLAVCVASFLALAVSLHTLLAAGGWSKRYRAQQDLETLHATNQQTAVRIEALRKRIDALRTKPHVQERVIRQELGYVRGKDVIIRFNSDLPKQAIATK